MGIYHGSILVVGFKLDGNKLYEWMIKNEIEDLDEAYDHPIFTNLSRDLFIIKAGDAFDYNYWSDADFYLSFFDDNMVNIGRIKKITKEHLESAKKVYKELMSEELDCKSVDDVEVFAVNYCGQG